MMNRQSGFSLVEIAIVLVVLVVIGSVGYLAYTNFLAPKDQKASSDSSQTESVSIENTEDLSKASSDLDNTTLSDSDLDELNKAIQDF